MAERIHMPTETDMSNALLTLAQWFSPSFPLGAFAYSHGLEWAIETGEVTDAAMLESWLRNVLTFGAGRNDAVFICCAYRAGAKGLAELDVLCRVMSPSKERLLETVQQGRAFAVTTAAISGVECPEMALPVAVGWAARQQNLPLAETLQFYLHAFASNFVLSAVRLIPLGQTQGQICLSNLQADCLKLAREALHATVDDLGSTAFAVDIASMKHETQYSRIFRS